MVQARQLRAARRRVAELQGALDYAKRKAAVSITFEELEDIDEQVRAQYPESDAVLDMPDDIYCKFCGAFVHFPEDQCPGAPQNSACNQGSVSLSTDGASEEGMAEGSGCLPRTPPLDGVPPEQPPDVEVPSELAPCPDLAASSECSPPAELTTGLAPSSERTPPTELPAERTLPEELLTQRLPPAEERLQHRTPPLDVPPEQPPDGEVPTELAHCSKMAPCPELALCSECPLPKELPTECMHPEELPAQRLPPAEEHPQHGVMGHLPPMPAVPGIRAQPCPSSSSCEEVVLFRRDRDVDPAPAPAARPPCEPNGDDGRHQLFGARASDTGRGQHLLGRPRPAAARGATPPDHQGIPPAGAADAAAPPAEAAEVAQWQWKEEDRAGYISANHFSGPTLAEGTATSSAPDPPQCVAAAPHRMADDPAPPRRFTAVQLAWAASAATKCSIQRAAPAWSAWRALAALRRVGRAAGRARQSAYRSIIACIRRGDFCGCGTYGVVQKETIEVVTKRPSHPDFEAELTAEYRMLQYIGAAPEHRGAAFIVGLISAAPDCMVLERCRGDLSTLRPPRAVRKAISRQLLLGLEFLHSLSVVHLDLKPANLLVAYSDQLKIADFGLARMEGEVTSGGGWTLWWRPPEALMMGRAPREVRCQEDLWAAGLIIAQFFDDGYEHPLLPVAEGESDARARHVLRRCEEFAAERASWELMHLFSRITPERTRELFNDDGTVADPERREHPLRPGVYYTQAEWGAVTGAFWDTAHPLGPVDRARDLDPQCGAAVVALCRLDPRQRTPAAECLKYL
eukprot:TRINITY_DN19788_c0_g1_i1.p1 TRINITY_DN19788_c0_g1~~TRINITY_DN19788_c0_g1_i1.p1  ORF type:complete len:815 (+),score=146.04 TRINITY_DN19788_c0_g1_i1:46-2445(+)